VNLTYAATTVVALLLGFLAGLLTFKRTLRWCRTCGLVLRCPECGGRRSIAHPADQRPAGRP
jgi:predicted RNA-binding protein with PUA domain